MAAKRAERERAPDFGFSDAERDSLAAFVRTDFGSLLRNDPAETSQRLMADLRCTACHALDAREDTWSKISAHLDEPLSAAQMAAALKKEHFNDHQGRPMLTWTGEKLHADWMVQFLKGDITSKPRPGLLARMPAFPSYAAMLAKGLAMQHGLDGRRRHETPLDMEAVATGQKLIDTGAFSCVTCHGVGDKLPVVGATLQAINLAEVHGRLRKEFYHLWIVNPQRIEPGTMMPRFMEDDLQSPFKSYYGGDGGRQIEAIWEFMRSLDKAR
jgi:mono/diheme cytochrome c family protein